MTKMTDLTEDVTAEKLARFTTSLRRRAAAATAAANAAAAFELCTLRCSLAARLGNWDWQESEGVGL